MKKIAVAVIIPITLWGIVGCYSSSRSSMAPVVDLAASNRPPAPKTYTVQRGDTLSNIATRYHYSYQQIIQWNHLKSPYVLNEGQVLYFYPSAVPSSEQGRAGFPPFPTAPSAQDDFGDSGAEVIAIPLK